MSELAKRETGGRPGVLAVGSVVRLSRDAWPAEDCKNTGIGKVVPPVGGGFVWVQWGGDAVAMQCRYRWGADDTYDLEIVSSAP